MSREQPEPLRYSEVRPDRFDRFEDYVAPADGLERAIDQAPLRDERGPPAYANRGYAHLKGGR